MVRRREQTAQMALLTMGECQEILSFFLPKQSWDPVRVQNWILSSISSACSHTHLWRMAHMDVIDHPAINLINWPDEHRICMIPGIQQKVSQTMLAFLLVYCINSYISFNLNYWFRLKGQNLAALKFSFCFAHSRKLENKNEPLWYLHGSDCVWDPELRTHSNIELLQCGQIL